MIITKKNKSKKKFYVKDKIINIIVDFNKSYLCNLCNSLCKHCIFILQNIYHLSDFTLEFINDKTIFKEFINNKNNDDLEQIIINKIESSECGICLKKLTFLYELHKCNICHNYSHYKCINKWLQKKNYCIYCMN
jgi:hypothetical protein